VLLESLQKFAVILSRRRVILREAGSPSEGFSSGKVMYLLAFLSLRTPVALRATLGGSGVGNAGSGAFTHSRVLIETVEQK